MKMKEGMIMSDRKRKRIARLIKWNRWAKLSKMLQKGDAETRIAIAAEFAGSNDDHAYNNLILLLKDSDDKVVEQAIKSLGELGHERAKVHLQNMLSNLPEEKKALADVIKESIAQINKAISQEG
jgi:HEAT repeat protein